MGLGSAALRGGKKEKKAGKAKKTAEEVAAEKAAKVAAAFFCKYHARNALQNLQNR